MASGQASQDYIPDHEVFRRVFTHVLYPNKFEAVIVRPDDVIASQAEDGTLSELCPSLKVPKLEALLEVPHQVNKAKLCK